MNYGSLIFLAAFFALSASWFGLVLAPQFQIGREQQTTTVASGQTYPLARPGLAQQGAEVYRANGCYYCHSQQIRQTGAVMDVILSNVGTNADAVAEALVKVTAGASTATAPGLAGGLPKPVMQKVRPDMAKAAAAAMSKAGAQVRTDLVLLGADISRGWGIRRSIAKDFLYDYPVMLGSLRAGPDLANISFRQPDAKWQLRHLYAPRHEVKDSTMPRYEYLFEVRRIIGTPSADALQLSGEFAPEPGFEVVPTADAKALVAYLLSLRADAPVFETPMTVILTPATTNAPGTTNGAAPVNVPSTNSAPNTNAAGQ